VQRIPEVSKRKEVSVQRNIRGRKGAKVGATGKKWSQDR